MKMSAQRFCARKPHRLGYAISALLTPDISAARAPSNVPRRRPHNPQRVAEGRQAPGRMPSRSIRWRPHDPGPGRRVLRFARRPWRRAGARGAGRCVDTRVERRWHGGSPPGAMQTLSCSGVATCTASGTNHAAPSSDNEGIPSSSGALRIAGRARPHCAERGTLEQR